MQNGTLSGFHIAIPKPPFIWIPFIVTESSNCMWNISFKVLGTASMEFYNNNITPPIKIILTYYDQPLKFSARNESDTKT